MWPIDLPRVLGANLPGVFWDHGSWRMVPPSRLVSHSSRSFVNSCGVRSLGSGEALVLRDYSPAMMATRLADLDTELKKGSPERQQEPRR